MGSGLGWALKPEGIFLQAGEGKEERGFLLKKAGRKESIKFDTINERNVFKKLRENGRIIRNKYLII